MTSHIEARVIEDSIYNGVRITTFQTVSPKFIDAEIEKHRMLSSYSSSDRAVPVSKMVNAPYHLPEHYFLNKPGMQGSDLLDDESMKELNEDIAALHDNTSNVMTKWQHVNKQHINRLLSPFSYQTKVITGTEWDNFFKLCIHEAAQPEMLELAIIMLFEKEWSEPVEREWHLPYITEDERNRYNPHLLARVSSARCARFSYNNHEGSDPVIEDDLELYNQLAMRPYTDKHGNLYDQNDPIHGSILEHAAKAMTQIKDIWSDDGQTHMRRDGTLWSANFHGWNQFRQMVFPPKRFTPP